MTKRGEKPKRVLWSPSRCQCSPGQWVPSWLASHLSLDFSCSSPVGNTAHRDTSYLYSIMITSMCFWLLTVLAFLPQTLFLFFFFFFFFFAFPSYISGVHHFWVRFLRMWPSVVLLSLLTKLLSERDGDKNHRGQRNGHHRLRNTPVNAGECQKSDLQPRFEPRRGWLGCFLVSEVIASTVIQHLCMNELLRFRSRTLVCVRDYVCMRATVLVCICALLCLWEWMCCMSLTDMATW